MKSMNSELLPPHIRYMLDPAIYPHPVDEVKLVQTHISFVLLAGDFVYKVKKPLDFGFLDFSTLSKRKYYCEQEVLLNQRLCPSIYLDVVSINRSGSDFSLNGAGEDIEYAVKMVRMPEDRMMVNVIRAGQLTNELIDRIVDVLIPFYRNADSSPDIQNYGTSTGVAVNVLENFEQTEEYVGLGALSREQFEQITRFSRKFLENEELFNSRISEGRVRDCHGDLHSANICLADKVYIYDCIEFNKRLRYGDVANDVAFFAMDLDFHGLEDMSVRFIERFKDASGDQDLSRVLNFYKCYRAYVRGKVGLFTAHGPEVSETDREFSLSQAEKYFRLAHQYAVTCSSSME